MALDSTQKENLQYVADVRGLIQALDDSKNSSPLERTSLINKGIGLYARGRLSGEVDLEAARTTMEAGGLEGALDRLSGNLSNSERAIAAKEAYNESFDEIYAKIECKINDAIADAKSLGDAASKAKKILDPLAPVRTLSPEEAGAVVLGLIGNAVGASTAHNLGYRADPSKVAESLQIEVIKESGLIEESKDSEGNATYKVSSALKDKLANEVVIGASMYALSDN